MYIYICIYIYVYIYVCRVNPLTHPVSARMDAARTGAQTFARCVVH